MGGENVASASAGGVGAFCLLYDKYYPLVFAEALRVTGENSSAEDVTQEVFFDVLRLCIGRRHERCSEAYLRRMARNRAYRWHRRREADRRILRELSLTAPNTVRETRLAAEVDLAVRELPSPLRRALFLRFKLGLSIEECGAALGVSGRTVERYVEKGIERLKLQFGTATSAMLIAWAVVDWRRCGPAPLREPNANAGSASVSAKPVASALRIGLKVSLAAGLALTVFFGAMSLLPRPAAQLAGNPVAGTPVDMQDADAVPARADAAPAMPAIAAGKELARAVPDESLVRIVVVDADSRLPVVGASVAQSSSAAGTSAASVTNGAGEVALAVADVRSGMEPGADGRQPPPWRLQVAAEGYGTRLIAIAGDRIAADAGEVLVELVPEQCRVAHVVDAGGAPIAAADVAWTWEMGTATSVGAPGMRRERTGPGGELVVSFPVRAAALRIAVAAKGFAPSCQRVAGEALAAETTLVLEVRAGHVFAGLLESVDGEPLAGRVVKVEPVDAELLPVWATALLRRGATHGAAEVAIDADGGFEFHDLPAGTYRVCIDGRGGATAPLVSVPCEGVWRHAWEAPGRPSGVVVDRDGIPCRDASVKVVGDLPVLLRCDCEGRFRLPADLCFPATLLVACPGFAGQEVTLEGCERGLTVVLEKTAEEASSLVLRVSRDGRTIGEEVMAVALREAGDARAYESSVVVRQGTAEIHDLAPGTYTLRVSMRGGASVERADVVVPSAEPLDVDFAGP